MNTNFFTQHIDKLLLETRLAESDALFEESPATPAAPADSGTAPAGSEFTDSLKKNNLVAGAVKETVEKSPEESKDTTEPLAIFLKEVKGVAGKFMTIMRDMGEKLFGGFVRFLYDVTKIFRGGTKQVFDVLKGASGTSRFKFFETIQNSIDKIFDVFKMTFGIKSKSDLSDDKKVTYSFLGVAIMIIGVAGLYYLIKYVRGGGGGFHLQNLCNFINHSYIPHLTKIQNKVFSIHSNRTLLMEQKNMLLEQEAEGLFGTVFGFIGKFFQAIIDAFSSVIGSADGLLFCVFLGVGGWLIYRYIIKGETPKKEETKPQNKSKEEIFLKNDIRLQKAAYDKALKGELKNTDIQRLAKQGIKRSVLQDLAAKNREVLVSKKQGTTPGGKKIVKARLIKTLY